jgi:hypothetical protein
LKNRGTPFAEKDETKADLIFNGIHLEIGGANKKQNWQILSSETI